MTDAITIQNPRNRGGSTGHVLAKRSVTFTEIRTQAGDPVDDPSQPWPAERQQIVAGTLEVTSVRDQTEGGCRDINFDPTLVPPGIELSNDPVLAARAGIYSHSYNARLREIGFGKATDAIGERKDK